MQMDSLDRLGRIREEIEVKSWTKVQIRVRSERSEERNKRWRA